MTKTCKSYSPEKKFVILRRHLIDNVPVSDLCEDVGLNPNVFYTWQKDFFESRAKVADTGIGFASCCGD